MVRSNPEQLQIHANLFKGRLRLFLLRTGKSFVQDVIELLKHSLIHNVTPQYEALTPKAEYLVTLVLAARQEYQASVRDVITELQGMSPAKRIWVCSNTPTASPTWQEVLRLTRAICDLKARAERQGWDQKKDEHYRRLEEDTIFNRADGPCSIVSYLETVLSGSSAVATNR
jgi:hypothetical protein